MIQKNYNSEDTWQRLSSTNCNLNVNGLCKGYCFLSLIKHAVKTALQDKTGNNLREIKNTQNPSESKITHSPCPHLVTDDHGVIVTSFKMLQSDCMAVEV